MDETINSWLFTFHTVLLGVKIWALFYITSLFILVRSQNQSYMIVFTTYTFFLFILSILMVGLEAWFMYSFFDAIDLYYYEYASILDQIIFTIVAVNYLIKEGNQYGKR